MTLENALKLLEHEQNKKRIAAPITFVEFLNKAEEKPHFALRNMFQYFYDMIHHYARPLSTAETDSCLIPNEYAYDPNSLFVNGLDKPFFIDRFFMESLFNLAHNLSKGQENRFYLFEGSPGSGKSRFLDGLIDRFEAYSRSDEGARYELIWKLPVDNAEKGVVKFLEVPCPHHDNPILLIPKEHRRQFVSELIGDRTQREDVLNNASFAWVFKKEACSICDSVTNALLQKGKSMDEILGMAHARRYILNRKIGYGVSVFTPGDNISIDEVIRNEQIEDQLNKLFGGSPKINYYYSRLAQTNDGIMVLMDLKQENIDRLRKLHGIISDEVHRTLDLEERTSSLFLITMNPGDAGEATQGEQKQGEQKAKFLTEQSYKDRTQKIIVPSLLDYTLEMQVYNANFGQNAFTEGFLPGIIEGFAKTVVSSRINNNSSQVIDKMLNTNKERYKYYTDDAYVLLRLNLFAGIMPTWLSEDDKKKFSHEQLKMVFKEFPEDGTKGISGRDANNYLSAMLADRDKMLRKDQKTRYDMNKLKEFIRTKMMPGTVLRPTFVDALENSYNYDLLTQINEALFMINEEHIDKDLADYVTTLSFEPGSQYVSLLTGREINVTPETFTMVENVMNIPKDQRVKYRNYMRDTVVQQCMTSQEHAMEWLSGQEFFKKMKGTYLYNLRTNALKQYHSIDLLRDCVKEFGTQNYQGFDEKVRRDTKQLLKKLRTDFGYTVLGAKQVILYTIDNKLYDKFVVQRVGSI